MEKLQELSELLLPAGILEYFDYEGLTKTNEEVVIVLTEKNTVPKLPDQYKDRTIRQKGFKKLTVNDFPVRGRKVKLLLRRRVWKIQGVKELYRKQIPEIIFPGTKLEKEFAAFLKEGD
jgi:hypothetical protein